MRRMGSALGMMLLLLAGCDSLQDQCIRLNARDLFLHDRQIAEAQANLQRGYALEEVEEREWRWVRCGPATPGGPGQPPEPPEMCWEEVSHFLVRPRPIDMAAERQRLAGLQAARAGLERAAAPALAECRARYPQ